MDNPSAHAAVPPDLGGADTGPYWLDGGQHDTGYLSWLEPLAAWRSLRFSSLVACLLVTISHLRVHHAFRDHPPDGSRSACDGRRKRGCAVAESATSACYSPLAPRPSTSLVPEPAASVASHPAHRPAWTWKHGTRQKGAPNFSSHERERRRSCPVSGSFSTADAGGPPRRLAHEVRPRRHGSLPQPEGDDMIARPPRVTPTDGHGDELLAGCEAIAHRRRLRALGQRSRPPCSSRGAGARRGRRRPPEMSTGWT